MMNTKCSRDKFGSLNQAIFSLEKEDFLIQIVSITNSTFSQMSTNVLIL